MGICVRHNDKYYLLSGNQVAGLLINYMLKVNEVEENMVLIDTIVSSNFAGKIATEKGIKRVTTFTGFKYIGSEMQNQIDQGNKLMLGYEEAIGYTPRSFVRDKDAHQVALLITEMASTYKENNRTLIDVLMMLYKKYGYFKEETISIFHHGKDGAEKIKHIMDQLRNKELEFKSLTFENKVDYINGEDPQNVIKYFFENDSFFAIRPSGTEPKIKLYFCVSSDSKKNSEELLDNLKKEVLNIMETI